MSQDVNIQPDQAASGSADQQPSFAIQRVYSKNSAFKLADVKDIKAKQWKPEMRVESNSNHKKLADGVYEVVLSLKAHTTLEGKDLFDVEFEQAGAFVIKNFNEDQLKNMLGSFCLSMLYPYASEAISSMVNRAGYPPIYLPAVNFEAIYQQRLAQAAKENQAQPAESAA